jgi:hypothetical protein
MINLTPHLPIPTHLKVGAGEGKTTLGCGAGSMESWLLVSRAMPFAAKRILDDAKLPTSVGNASLH